MAELKAPYPYFGGKSKVAAQVWRLLGDVDNFIEPFYGSGAVHLLRPGVPKIETINDVDCYIANFWRSTQHDPEAVAEHADGPVNEADLHSRHRFLVLSDDAVAFRKRMREDPDYFDAKIAGWWCWGLCMWIGSGWCDVAKLDPWEQKPDPAFSGGKGQGVHRTSQQVPAANDALTGMDAGQRQHLSQQLPRLTGQQGTHKLSQQRPAAPGERGDGKGIHNSNHLKGSERPQLADAYDIGRGVNANGELSTCEARRQWILDWFCRLRDRLRLVRVCCGDWLRVCGSESVTTRLGVTGIFLDPPYGAKAGRAKKLYSSEDLSVAERVREWCLQNGSHPLMRIVLCGYAGEGHEALEDAGWKVIHWKADGGYGNRSEVGRANAKKERMWCSPYCVWERGLFDEVES